MKIVLDTSILIRANKPSLGIARQLLMEIIQSQHTLLTSNEIFHELTEALRGQRFRLPDDLIYDYISLLSRTSEIVVLNPLITAPIRDSNDVIVIQTAIIGGADVLCTRDNDFFEDPACEYLKKMGIAVMDDIALIRRLRL